LGSIALVGGVPLGLYWVYMNVSPKEERLRIFLSQEATYRPHRLIMCGLENTGNVEMTVMEMLVNGSTATLAPYVNGRYPLPLGGLEPREQALFSFRYDGPWQGMLNLTFVTERGNAFSRLIQLEG